VPVAELRRRFGLEEPDEMIAISRNGTTAFIGIPAREAAKVEELWLRDELDVELSVDVRAPVVVGVFPIRIARYTVEHAGANGQALTGLAHVDDEPMADVIPAPSAVAGL
jgi:hypothetical protein